MKKSDFFYDLPERLIAQTPVEPRDCSKLLYYDRHRQGVFDKNFFDLPEILQKGDLLVINNTRVLPARIFGVKRGTGAKIEFLLHKRINLTDWEIISRPAKRLPIGAIVDFGFARNESELFVKNESSAESQFTEAETSAESKSAETESSVESKLSAESELYIKSKAPIEMLSAKAMLSAEIIGDLGSGEKIVRFAFDGVFEDILWRIGEMPLPPYIRERLTDGERYQTVYAKTEGSSAAPTAGLHFTPRLFERLKERGVDTAEVTLHVGLGTFLPVKTDDVLQHKMHSERYFLSRESAEKINNARREGRRVLAVGTTSVRVLETLADERGFVKEAVGETDIFIYPPYRFRAVDGLITNFHLPESTLIMLVSAFLTREKTLQLYSHAIEKEYRFFSFGDAMIIL